MLKNVVRNTTFEEEQIPKEDYFQSLSPVRRLEIAKEIRERMYKPGVNYSFKGLKVKITRPQ